MYEDIEKHGIRMTVITFEPFLKRPEVHHLTDSEIGRKYGLATSTVKAMREHQDVPFDTIRNLCYQLECQPGDILEAMTIYQIPAKKNAPDE